MISHLLAGLGGIAFCLAVWLLLIFSGELPRYTYTCANGRFVYMQDGHEEDRVLFCRALGSAP